MRIYELPTRLFTAESHNIFNGLRLHTLDLFNFSDHITLNFFKSFFGSIAGIRHALSVYISSTLYGWLGIPLNEYWLRFFYVCLGTISVAGTYVLGRMLADYRCGLVGAAILAINSDQILRSRNDNAEPMVTFIFLICLIALFSYKENPTWIRRTLLSFILPIAASMESIVILPLIVIYQIILFVPHEPSWSKKIGRCCQYLLSKENMLIWFPCLIAILIHIYVYFRIGMSNIGLFGYMVLTTSRKINELGFVDNFVKVYETYSKYYFNPIFFYSSLVAFVALVLDRKNNKLGKLLVFSGVGFFYFFILSLFTSADFATHLYICDSINVLFLGGVWLSLVQRSQGIYFFRNKSWVVCILSLFFLAQTSGLFQRVLERESLVHPLKSIGYYINENSEGSPTVYLLLDCYKYNVLFNAEFYFGTQIMNMGEQYNIPRKLFCMGSSSIEDTLSAYKLNDFDFYVAVYDIFSVDTGEKMTGDSLRFFWNGEISRKKQKYKSFRAKKIDSKIQELLANGVKRVAIIRNKGLIMGEIYSRRNIPFKEMELSEFDKLWDQKYANILGIVKTRWTGIAGTWGFIWDPETGI